MPTPSDTTPADDPTLTRAASGEVNDLAASQTPDLAPQSLESSTPFVGRWNELVSTTNWEKGRIISDWRAELENSGAPVTDYSDEAWARLVGGVTSQHVGRLRRAHERFGVAHTQYPRLYWSHFQAALDWDDSEMWLEGALTNQWSVSQMRAARWEAVGGPDTPDEGQVIEAQIDEDAYHALVDRPEAETNHGVESEGDSESAASEPRERSDDDGDAPFDSAPSDDTPDRPVDAAPRVQPFKDLAALPDDVAEAFEQFKLVILSHKLSGWDAISRDDLLGALESLKALAMAPSED